MNYRSLNKSERMENLRGCLDVVRISPIKIFQWNSFHKIIFLTSVCLIIEFFAVAPLSAQENTLEWHSFEVALQLAEQHEKPLLVDVWTPWCGWCKKMQKEVYPELSEKLNREFILTRLNRDDNESKTSYQNASLTPLRIAQKLNVQSVPAIVILSAEGEYLFHISGFLEAAQLESVLENASLVISNL